MVLPSESLMYMEVAMPRAPERWPASLLTIVTPRDQRESRHLTSYMTVGFPALGDYHIDTRIDGPAGLFHRSGLMHDKSAG